jgi:hypothetical protein
VFTRSIFANYATRAKKNTIGIFAKKNPSSITRRKTINRKAEDVQITSSVLEKKNKKTCVFLG